MGIVYEGWDTQLNRDVALKVLRKTLRAKPAAVQRFLDEARITGRLQHAGVVAIHELGRLPDDRPFFVMSLVRGETLQEVLARREDPAADFGRLLFVFEKVCETVAYAHAKEVIHRDLKSANIMVGAFGVVHVMDWGLAKVLGEPDPIEALVAAEIAGTLEDADANANADPSALDHGLWKTQVGTVFGTPAYFSPEQARGEIDRLDPRADVFALGSILCEILTGQPPYTGANLTEVYAKAVDARIGEALQRLDACSAPLDLITLAKACLEPRTDARPASGVEVARAVRDYLQSEQRRAERDLVRFFDLSLDLFCIASTAGYFERVNENFSRVLGYSSEELTSRPFMDYVHPEDQDSTRTEVVRLSAGEPCIRFLNRYQHAGGHYLWLEWNARSVPEEKAIYAVARDVSERMALAEAHRRVEQERLHLAEVVNSVEVAIISTTLDGAILGWNRGAQSIFGYSAAEMIGQPVRLLLPPECLVEEEEILPRLRRGEQVEHFETVRLGKDGRRIDVSVALSPILDADGRVIGASKVARDLTGRNAPRSRLSDG